MAENEIYLSGQANMKVRASAKLSIHEPLPAGHPCYALIGQITSEFARIEHFLDAAIFDLAKIDNTIGPCLTSPLTGLFPRYMILHQLASVLNLPASITKEIKRQDDISNKIADLRNRAIHDSWLQNCDTNELAQFKTRTKKDSKYGPSITSIERLKADLQAISAHLERVMALSLTIYNHRHGYA